MTRVRADAGIGQHRYRVIRTLEEGNAGSLLHVHDTLRQEHLAARVIPQTGKVGDETRQIFQRLEQMDHPGIAKLVDFGESDARVFYTRELIGELSLKEALTSADPKPDIYTCLVEAALALEALHDGGCVHGMLHSGFVRVASGERIAGVYLVDAGLRGLVPKASIAALGVHEAPETRAEGVISPATDVYQLGAAFLDAMGGMKSRGIQRRGPRRQPTSEEDRDLLEFIESLLAPRPRQRPANGKELGRALRSTEWIRPERKRDVASLLSAALVGREQVMALFDDHLAQALEGNLHALEVIGERGSGRSRILRELGVMASIQGWTVFNLQEIGRPVSFAGLLAALGQPIGIDSFEVQQERKGQVFRGAESERDETPRWAALAAVVLEAVKQGDRNLLIMLDDIDKADRELRMVLRHVITETSGHPFLVVATSHRGRELPESATVKLELLTERELKRLCAPLLAESLNPDTTLAALREAWGGRPLWLRLYLTLWMENGQLRFVGGRPFFDEKRQNESPATIVEAILALVTVDEKVRDLCELLAIWGGPLPRAIAEQLLPRGAIYSTDLVRLEGEVLGFRGNSIGPIISNTMSASHRQKWHGLIVKKVPASELSPKQRARHLLGAGHTPEAVDGLIRAAKEREAAGAYSAAFDHFRMAVEALGEGVDLEVVLDAARLAINVGEFNWGRVKLEAFATSFEEAKKRGRESLHLEYLLLRANTLRWLQHAEEASPFYEMARRCSEQTPALRHRLWEIVLEQSANEALMGQAEAGLKQIEPLLVEMEKAGSLSLLAVAYRRLGMLHAARGDANMAAKYELRCVRLAKKVGDDHLVARALTSLGSLHHLRNRPLAALRALARAERALQLCPNDNLMAAVLVNRASVLLKAGKAREAETGLLRAKALRERAGIVSGVPNILIGLGNIHRKAGRLSWAARHFQDAITLAEEYELRAVHVARADLGSVLLRQGQDVAAEDVLKRALASPRADHRGIIYVKLARLFRQRRQWAVALRALEEGRKLLQRNLSAAWPLAMIEEARVLLDAEDLEGSAQRLVTVVDQLATDEQRAEYYLVEGLIAQQQGKSPEAAFDEAIVAAQQVDDPTLLAEILVEAIGSVLNASRVGDSWIRKQMTLLGATIKRTDAEPVVTRFEALEGALAKRRSSLMSSDEMAERIRKRILEERGDTLAPPLGDVVRDLDASGALVFVVGLGADGQATLSPVATPASEDPAKMRPYRAAARAFDRKIFGEALAAAEGNVVEAARLLDMPSSTFRYQAEKLKLIKPVRRDG